jgi:hypothetical protein
MRADIVGGAVFPDYELTDHTGKHRETGVRLRGWSNFTTRWKSVTLGSSPSALTTCF